MGTSTKEEKGGVGFHQGDEGVGRSFYKGRGGDVKLTNKMGDLNGGWTFKTCARDYEGSVVEWGKVGVPLEISKVVVRRRWGGRIRRRRAKEDHPVITLALRETPFSLTRTHNKKLTASLVSFLHS